MKILIYEWGAYTQKDVNTTLKENNISFKSVSYKFKDKNQDDFFMNRFEKYLQEDQYDAVFSINYFPLVAQACFHHSIKYISWSYDNPLDVRQIEDTLGYFTNYVFLFDQVQVQTYIKKGYQNIFHMPLAVNTNRLDQLKITAVDHQKYDAEISFVGKLYPSPMLELLQPLPDYSKGYLDAMMEAQLKVYGYYMIDELLTDDFMKNLNQQYVKSLGHSNFKLSREELSYAMATNITRKERLTILALLSNYHQVKLYSREQHQALSKVIHMGSAKYDEEMPKIFKSTKINLNITLKILQTGIPLRVLDILGAGGFLLTNYQEEIFQYFENERDLVMYQSIEDAYEKVNFYLKHDDIREKIAISGYEKVKENFSYKKQLNAIFKAADIS
ncbi:MAG TPA: DUF3880 domain-containing protein [Lachnospiraceae bacterium]|nr:DUF3880 domain-containing protein [Lachnospiraceae bacterium]